MIALRLKKYGPVLKKATGMSLVVDLKPEVVAWLNDTIGPGVVYTLPKELDPSNQWRLQKVLYSDKRPDGSIDNFSSYALIEFRTEFQALLFKLQWGHGVRHRSHR